MRLMKVSWPFLVNRSTCASSSSRQFCQVSPKSLRPRGEAEMRSCKSKKFILQVFLRRSLSFSLSLHFSQFSNFQTSLTPLLFNPLNSSFYIMPIDTHVKRAHPILFGLLILFTLVGWAMCAAVVNHCESTTFLHYLERVESMRSVERDF